MSEKERYEELYPYHEECGLNHTVGADCAMVAECIAVDERTWRNAQ